MGLFDRANRTAANKPDQDSSTATPAGLHAGTQPPVERIPHVDESDVADMESLMNEWAAATDTADDSDRVWASLESIATRGGFPGVPVMLERALAARRGGPAFDANDVMQDPWRWISAVASLARQSGDNILVGRIFLFMYFWELLLVPKMTIRDHATTGLAVPNPEYRKAIAAEAVQALRWVRPDLMVDSVTDAGTTLDIATRVANGAKQ